MATLTVDSKDLEKLVENKVNSALRIALDDPDFGLEYQPSFLRDMKKILKSRPTKLIPFEEIRRKYG